MGLSVVFFISFDSFEKLCIKRVLTYSVKMIFHENCRPNNYKNFDVYMFIFSPKKGQNITIITKKNERKY